MSTNYVHYHPAVSTHLEEFSANTDFADCLCVRFIDPNDWGIVSEFRFEDSAQYREIVELLQTGLEMLETLEAFGYDEATDRFNLESVSECDIEITGELTVDDILKEER